MVLWLCYAVSFLLRHLDPGGQVVAFFTWIIYKLCKFSGIVIFSASISAWIFYARQDWLFWVGIPTPTEVIWKEAPAFFIYGMAFLFGWLFDRQRDCLEILKSHWPRYLILAIALTGVSFSQLTYPAFVVVEVSSTEKLTFALIYAFASWSWVFALIGAGMRFFGKKMKYDAILRMPPTGFISPTCH